MKRVTIYWKTKDREVMKKIMNRFNITCGWTVNGESEFDIPDGDMDVLIETAKRGFLDIRKVKD